MLALEKGMQLLIALVKQHLKLKDDENESKRRVLHNQMQELKSKLVAAEMRSHVARIQSKHMVKSLEKEVKLLLRGKPLE